MSLPLFLLFLVVVLGADVWGSPLPPAGPHLSGGWGEPVRLRHLYAARPGLHLHIYTDGSVRGGAQQSPYSLLEITPVDAGFVAMKGVASSHYLCMDARGKLYGSHSYAKKDCSFQEKILPDGYSIYSARTGGALLSLASGTHGSHTLAQFLPMVSSLPPDVPDGSVARAHTRAHTHAHTRAHTHAHTHVESAEHMDSMDPFGKVSQAFIQSPSFS